MDPISLGELRVILKKIPARYDRNKVQITIYDDDARGIDNAPGISMKGYLDHVIAPSQGNPDVRFIAGGEAHI